MIRPLTADDADELAALLVENRAFLAPFEPDRGEHFYTVEGQQERLEREDKHVFGVLDGERIAGTVALSNVGRAIGTEAPDAQRSSTVPPGLLTPRRHARFT